jgi:hypothetical protein
VTDSQSFRRLRGDPEPLNVWVFPRQMVTDGIETTALGLRWLCSRSGLVALLGIVFDANEVVEEVCGIVEAAIEDVATEVDKAPARPCGVTFEQPFLDADRDWPVVALAGFTRHTVIPFL